MSIENPRQEADTPRMPELSWSPSKREVYWLPDPTATNVWALELVDESLPSDELPADAVKLGDVEALRAKLEAQRKLHDREMQQGVEAIRERDALRADYWNLCNTADQAITAAARERDALRAQLNRARAALHDWSEHDEIRDILEGGEPCPEDPKPAATELPPISRDRWFQFDPLRIGVNNPTPVDQQDDQAGQ